ncbi:MAG: hypothetical protein WC340_08205 [Kiritimatiellia bacterium]
MKNVTRRTAIASTIGAGVALGAVLKPQGAKAAAACNLKRGDMYKEGKLDVPAVKRAYFDMLKKFNYPVPDILKTDEFWVADFVQGDVLKEGMGGIFWINESGTYAAHGAKKYNGKFNDIKFGYLGHEIYLLPGQTLPEHCHIGGADGYGPKMEAWQVRYGEVTFFGEYKGEGSEVALSELPEAKRPWGCGAAWMHSKFALTIPATSGKLYVQRDPEAWHGQKAGPEGAIVTEYGTYHNHVMFSKPGMSFGCTGHS